MQKIVLATGNAGKLKELQALLADQPFAIVSQKEMGVSDAEETGLSFVENAILKARHAARATGLPALADDSGLCVDVLGGAPGIYSARYSGAGVILKMSRAGATTIRHAKRRESACHLF